MKPPAKKEILAVSELTARIAGCLEKEFPEVWVRGEVSEFLRHGSGHWYFTLKDEKAQTRAVMFKFQNLYLRFEPKNGSEVICRGRVTIYAQRSIYQLKVEWMEPLGRGALDLKFQQLKDRLLQEGLFDPGRKRPIPSPLRRIAIITSLSGAALQDMLRILRERDPGIEVLIIPSAVQGEGAAEELARGLARANRPEVARAPGRRPLEAVIIGRGGGSLEDLWAFNEEVLARAIFASRVPVISAVGHEVDTTIADLVADLRAPTPTAAAEMVAAGRAERTQRIRHDLHRLYSAMIHQLESSQADLANVAVRLKDPSRMILDYMMRTDELWARAARAIRTRTDFLEQRLVRHELSLHGRDPRTRYRLLATRLDHLSDRLRSAGTQPLVSALHGLDTLAASLEALSPRAALARGFAIARDKHGRLIRDAGTAAPGSELELLLWKGRLDCEVRKVILEEEK